MARLRALHGDITTAAVDAIVNAANSGLMGGGGVDGAIHRAGGPSIIAECRAIIARQGGCPPGDAVVTGAGELTADIVIHTVGPFWRDDAAAECDIILASCYRRSLELAELHGARTIAFPNIATGIYGFPKPRAAAIAVETVRHHVAGTDSIDEVLFVCFDEANLRHYTALLGT